MCWGMARPHCVALICLICEAEEDRFDPSEYSDDDWDALISNIHDVKARLYLNLSSRFTASPD